METYEVTYLAHSAEIPGVASLDLHRAEDSGSTAPSSLALYQSTMVAVTSDCTTLNVITIKEKKCTFPLLS